MSQIHKNGRLNKVAIDAAMEYFPFKRSQIKPKYSQESLMTAIQCTPLSQRSTLCSLSNVTLIPVSTLGKMHKKGWFLRHSNAVKPFLTDVKKIARLNFAKSFVNPRTQKFINMYNYLHIDEKWFYMTKINTNY